MPASRLPALVVGRKDCRQNRKFEGADATYLGAPILSVPTLDACAAACNATLLCGVILYNRYRQCFLLRTPDGAVPDIPGHGSVACSLRHESAPIWRRLSNFLQLARPSGRSVGRDTRDIVLAAAAEQHARAPSLPVRPPRRPPTKFARQPPASSAPTHSLQVRLVRLARPSASLTSSYSTYVGQRNVYTP